MRQTLGLALLAVSAVTTAGCWQSPSSQSGAAELFQVTNSNAQFIRGPFPGRPLQADGGSPSDEIARDAGVLPAPAHLSVQPSIYLPFGGTGNLQGYATKETASVAMALDGVSTGYWVIPLGTLDLTYNLLGFTANIALESSVRPGNHLIRVAGIDGNGAPGESATAPMCTYSAALGGNCQNPAVRAAISLNWFENVDLDLQVQTPDGTIVSAKHPSTKPDGGPPTANDGQFGTPNDYDYDSMMNCVPDGVRNENVIWKYELPHGTYDIYVNLFDSCKHPSAPFKVTVYGSSTYPDGGAGPLEEKWSANGELLDFQAVPDSTKRGLFVGEYTF